MSSPQYPPVQSWQTRPVHMSQFEKVAHALMIIFTAGLWLPVYLSRKRSLRGRTVTTVQR